MEKHYSVIKSSSLFSGITENEVSAMLPCLKARIKEYENSEFLLRAGESTDEIGLVLDGEVLVIQEDIWGNRNILHKVNPGQTFAVAFACAPGAVLNVSVVAVNSATVMLLNVKKILTTCLSGCEHHNRIIRNLLAEIAEKSLQLNEKLTHIGQRTTRAKLMAYLSYKMKREGKCEFDIPFSRQQLADYLGVERSGLSLELGKMKKEGMLDFHKNHFKLKPWQELD